MILRDNFRSKLLVEHSAVRPPLFTIIHEPDVSVPACPKEGVARYLSLCVCSYSDSQFVDHHTNRPEADIIDEFESVMVKSLSDTDLPEYTEARFSNRSFAT